MYKCKCVQRCLCARWCGDTYSLPRLLLYRVTYENLVKISFILLWQGHYIGETLLTDIDLLSLKLKVAPISIQLPYLFYTRNIITEMLGFIIV